MTLNQTSLFPLLVRWRRNAEERRRLASLPDGALKDLGLSRADVWQEVQKPFWRA